jgi:diacylglycerol kinase family enzyme
MRVLIVFNPVSGRGKALRASHLLERALRGAGHVVERHPTPAEPAPGWLDPGEAEAVVVAGGDGAIRQVAETLVGTLVPVYHVPGGTENLFARAFGMDGEPTRLVAALERMDVASIDTGTAGGIRFVLMVSVGLDAEVIHDLAARRGASIRHLSYVGPIARQLRRWTPPVLTVDVDGRTIAADRPGVVVVANCRQYGGRLDPAPRALLDDGLLDIVWFPAAGRRELAAWAIACRRGRHLRDPRLVSARGRNIRLDSTLPFRVQLDGDPARWAEGDVRTELTIEVDPASLRVLRP